MPRPRYRRRELLPHQGAMRPLYGRRRKLRTLFLSTAERAHVAQLLANGANPLSLRKGIPLFWYRAFGPGGLQWLERSGLNHQDLARLATMPDGSRRTLFDQVCMQPLSLRHLLGRGIGRRFSVLGTTIRRPSTDPNRLPTYDELAAYLIACGAFSPSPTLAADLLARDWPMVRIQLEALHLERTVKASGMETCARRL